MGLLAPGEHSSLRGTIFPAHFPHGHEFLANNRQFANARLIVHQAINSMRLSLKSCAEKI